jgi:hypothetical protein
LGVKNDGAGRALYMLQGGCFAILKDQRVLHLMDDFALFFYLYGAFDMRGVDRTHCVPELNV